SGPTRARHRTTGRCGDADQAGGSRESSPGLAGATSMKIFLSAVSGQFRDCRQALASDLRAMGAEVAVQEDFQQHGRTLLEKLQDYIDGCDRIIALVGDA